ncbi:hypothetical protein N864_07105 [Intrasporangium chromatireducens Q5-1]|uniref:Oxidoreductase n=1 Tax=Intrasporangium chromatireducens Q5-1 TaxID=584657 RepID=W9GQ66_9MICO|nr:hypothetical protein [Intrasporangium chromatireducens]EWT06978.1 hypothetical protein N864_07105 [Intrasporangium chromatireducens Q5-1]
MNQRFATAGLAAFLLADVALVALAMRPSGHHARADLPLNLPANVAGTTSPETPTPEAKVPRYNPAPLQRMIVALDAKHAWRATAGTCADGGALVQSTSDGGKTWTKGSSPVRAIVRVQPLQDSSGFIYGATKDCDLSEYVSADGARNWDGPRPVDGAWARHLTDDKVVITPQVGASRPCGDQSVVDLSRISATEAEVLCLDGGVKATNDGGASWTGEGSAPGALALSARNEDGSLATYAVRGSANCKGLEIVRVLKGKAEPEQTGCLATETPADPGTVSLSTTARSGWLSIGDQTWTSRDLKAWAKA